MKITELIAELEKIKQQHGDILVLITIGDDENVQQHVVPLRKDGILADNWLIEGHGVMPGVNLCWY